MDKQSLHETAKRLALELPFVELCWPFGPEFDVFKIGGKIFMLSSELRGVPFINLKSDPQKSLLNQQIYPSIKPGYHMNKKHWISVYPGEEISEALLRDLINDSWNLVVDGLAKRDQKKSASRLKRESIAHFSRLPFLVEPCNLLARKITFTWSLYGYHFCRLKASFH